MLKTLIEIIWLILGLSLSFITLPGTIELLFLTIGALLPTRQSLANTDDIVSHPKTIANNTLNHIAIVIPAHNEATVIARCITSLLTCKKPNSQFSIYVIADNCTDDTASYAKAVGAQVFIRHNKEQHGKGYAIEYAFNKLLEQTTNAIDAILIIDADTVAKPDFIQVCEQAFINGAEALQCRYEVDNYQQTLVGIARLRYIALLAFNVLRPYGRERWGLSVGIAGNGFGLSKRVLKKVPYHAYSMVEDLEYHILLTCAGVRVRFINKPLLQTTLPTDYQGIKAQYTRWEGGRLRIMYKYIPILFHQIIVTKQLNLLEPLLELLLLPLTLHVSLLLVILLIPLIFTQNYALLGLSIISLHVLITLWVSGSTFKELVTLTNVPFYICWKLFQLPYVINTARKKEGWKKH